MQIAIVANGSVVKIGNYQELFPNTSFPPSGPDAEFMADNNCLPVTLWKPYNHSTEKLSPCPAYIEGDQVFTVEVLPLTPEEIQARNDSQWANVRAERGRKLAACDWTQVDDAPLSNLVKLNWATYRQALRDITLQPDPFNIIWPKDPNWVPPPEEIVNA